MSHYTVLVIGGNVEGKLEPYDENLEVEPYIKHTKAEVVADKRNAIMWKYEARKKYENMPIKEFITEWYGLQADDECNALTTYNPQSKWDWYSIGGRWQGMFKLKEGELTCPDKTIVGKKSFLDKEPYEKGWVDQACFGDIDFEGMKKAHDISEIEKDWDENISGNGWYTPEYLIKRYETKEKYIENQTMFCTYAVITEDGEWHEPGEMLYFGMSAATTEERADWDDTFWDTFMKDLNPDTLLTVVDCHI